MDSAELVEWMAFYCIDPWGDQRDDLRAGLITAGLFNSNPFRSRGSPSASPLDFMLYPDDKHVSRTQLTEADDIEQYFSALAQAYGD